MRYVTKEEKEERLKKIFDYELSNIKDIDKAREDKKNRSAARSIIERAKKLEW